MQGLQLALCQSAKWSTFSIAGLFALGYRRRPALSDPVLGFVRTCTFQRCTLQIERSHIPPSAAQISTSTLVGVYLRAQNHVRIIIILSSAMSKIIHHLASCIILIIYRRTFIIKCFVLSVTFYFDNKFKYTAITVLNLL